MFKKHRKRRVGLAFENQFHDERPSGPRSSGAPITRQAPRYHYDTITDTQGLQRAYNQGDYYVHGGTLFVAGSHTLKDWFDDFTKIPFYGDLRSSARYQKALVAFQDNPVIDTVVGHSLGGSVALELQKNYPNRIQKSRTYGAPVFDVLGTEAENVDRYRNWGDPVSVFDRGARKSVKWKPFEAASLAHDYGNIADKINDTTIVPN